MQTKARTNFLVIITDQQRGDHVGYAGNKEIRTPNIDALANSGNWFSNFHVASPICMVNRATFMTGRMPSLHGVRHNGIPLGREQTTFVELLRAAGYSTGLIGKCHLQNMSLELPGYSQTEANELVPPPENLSEARKPSFPNSAYEEESLTAWRSGERQDLSKPYYGFDEISLVIGHGDTVSGHYENWLKDRGENQNRERGPEYALAKSKTGAPQVYQPNIPENFYPTSYIRDETLAFLDMAGASKDPFFLQCSFPDPHHPFVPPGHYWDMYDADKLSLPESYHLSARDQIPPLELLKKAYEDEHKQGRWTSPFMASEDQTREIIAKTYGQITMIDDAIGNILKRLSDRGLEKNTVVVFMSDHGDWMGDHGLILKGPMHYQSLIRVPFIWRDTDVASNSGHCDALAGTIDLARTILCKAGLQANNGMQGINLLPLFSGTAPSRDRLLVEQTTQYTDLGLGPNISVTTLRSGPWRLTVWENETWGELYQLKTDPHELNNLWDDPSMANTKTDLLHQLICEMQSHQDQSPYPMGRG